MAERGASMVDERDGSATDAGFSAALIAWQRVHGRHQLPWQNTRDAYRIWLSEIMLQQTQVAAVIPYYQRFLLRFPDVAALAAAPLEQVMAQWSGLGYYSRARNLHQCARLLVQQHGGVFPRDPLLLAQLPGIGVSTAAAIAAFAYGVRAAILDGNVKRVLARVFGIDDDIDSAPVQRRLWQQARALLPQSDIEAYTQGLMDLGATICTRTRPACAECPLRQRCVALAQDRVAQLPRRRPKPPRPEKHVTLLLVLDHGQVLLQQRPPSGIWGGLLSLPEVEPLAATWPDAAVPAALLRALEPIGVLAQAQPLPAFTHVFTHFRLQIAPLRITLQRRAALVGQLAQAWYGPAQLAQAALPAPVRRLLLHVLPPVPA